MAHKAAGSDDFAEEIVCGNGIVCRQRYELPSNIGGVSGPNTPADRAFFRSPR